MEPVTDDDVLYIGTLSRILCPIHPDSCTTAPPVTPPPDATPAIGTQAPELLAWAARVYPQYFTGACTEGGTDGYGYQLSGTGGARSGGTGTGTGTGGTMGATESDLPVGRVTTQGIDGGESDTGVNERSAATGPAPSTASRSIAGCPNRAQVCKPLHAIPQTTTAILPISGQAWRFFDAHCRTARMPKWDAIRTSSRLGKEGWPAPVEAIPAPAAPPATAAHPTAARWTTRRPMPSARRPPATAVSTTRQTRPACAHNSRVCSSCTARARRRPSIVLHTAAEPVGKR